MAKSKTIKKSKPKKTTKKDKNKGGRPTDYTPKLAEEICNAISKSDKGLAKLCDDNPHWPDRSTILRWVDLHDEFRDQYTRAREHQAHYLVDQTIEIADDSSQDELLDRHGNPYLNKEFVYRSELRVKARQWAAERLAPKKYGAKITQQLEGGEKPVAVEHTGYVALIPAEAESIDEWEAGNLETSTGSTD
jgi:hypothetical protein